MAQSLINKDAIDVSQVFQTYMTFGGDVARTAAATGFTAEQITTLANSEHWDEKLQQWNLLKEGDGKELQIQINRAVTYVQAHRLRSILDRLVSHLTKKTDDELVNLLTKQFHVQGGGKNSSVDRTEFSTRPLTDLVRAAKECADMTAKALGDVQRDEAEPEGKKKGNIALMVRRMMDLADSSDLPADKLVKQQLLAPPTTSKVG